MVQQTEHRDFACCNWLRLRNSKQANRLAEPHQAVAKKAPVVLTKVPAGAFLQAGVVPDVGVLGL